MSPEKDKFIDTSEGGSRKESKPWPGRMALGGLLLIIGLFAFSPLEDYDFWWHLKVGEVIYQTRDIVRTDLFSFTSPGAYWLDHSWLAELGLYGAWQAGNVTGVLLLKVILLVFTFLFLYGALRGTPHPLVPLLVTAAAAATTRVGWEARPQTFSYLFFTLLLFLLERKKGRYFLPLIMLLWANTHGSFFLGLIVIGTYTLEAWMGYYRQRRGGEMLLPIAPTPKKEAITLTLLFLAAFAASWINPHPLQLYAHPWIHLHQVFPRAIAEWAPPGFTDAPAFWIFLGLTLLSLPLAFKKIRLAHLVLFLVFLYPGLRYLRNVPYLTLAAAPLLGYALTYSLQQIEEMFPRLSKPLEHPVGSKDTARRAFTLNPLYLLSAAFLIFTFLAWAAGWGGRGGVNYQRFPQKAVDFYQQAEVKGPLFNTYDWGGYLTFRLWPREKVFILGITSDEGVFNQYFHISEGKISWRTSLDRYHVNTIITKTCYDEGGMLPYIVKLYLDEGWWLIYQDDTAVMLVRAAENNRYLASLRLPKEKLFLTVLAEEKRILKRKPNNPSALYFTALAYYMLGENDRAEKNLKGFLQVSPASPHADKLIQTLQEGRKPHNFLEETYGR